ncbi:hypothetical protein [Candidatus Coxiella mudrowiae]|uniref:hypothetical protein n=1 Tax=Candidatus Coxiella mudrowiae TaxID=2054173 RepID=UPI001FD5AA7F|nr:hypothetical protein [Candidatus Coxiella mudrowiae]
MYTNYLLRLANNNERDEQRYPLDFPNFLYIRHRGSSCGTQKYLALSLFSWIKWRWCLCFLYLCFVVILLGIPLMTLRVLLGRIGRGNPALALRNVSLKIKRSLHCKLLGGSTTHTSGFFNFNLLS